MSTTVTQGEAVTSIGLFYDSLNSVEIGWFKDPGFTNPKPFSVWIYGGGYQEHLGSNYISGSHNFGVKFIQGDEQTPSKWHFGADGDTTYVHDVFSSGVFSTGLPVTNVERDFATTTFNADVLFTELKYNSGLNWYYWESYGCFFDNDNVKQHDRRDNSPTKVRVVTNPAGANC